MNFSVLPPEINSALMFAGAGSGPMLAAATAWNGLADELGSAAASFASLTSGLAGSAWQGPASAARAAAAAPYAGWLSAAAAHAGGAAGQARSVAAVYESAVAATVHPAMVSGNRSQLVSLVWSNLFGQNAPAIAAAEADYEQMWAQGVVAMSGYHSGASQVAAAMTPMDSLAEVARVVEADYVAVEVALETDIAAVEREAAVVAKAVRRYAETAGRVIAQRV
jgi:PPE-repeat protein